MLIVSCSGSNEYGQDGFGNQTGTASGAMQQVTTDNNGATLPPIVQILMSGNNGTNYLCNFLLSTIASGGLVYMSGGGQNGMQGDGTSGSLQTKFKLCTMPAGDTIVKIQGIYGIIALSNHDSIIAWGSSFGNTPSYLHLPHGWKAYDVAGNGIAYWALADSSGTKGVFSCSPIFSTEPAYQGQGSGGTSHSTFTRVDNNNFVHPMMAGGDYPRFVTCNNEVTYFVTVANKLWDIGGNAVGDISNGKEINFASYSTPWDWDQGLNENNQDTIYNVAPGTSDWDTVYTSMSNCWAYCGTHWNGSFHQGGRIKQAQIWNMHVDGDPNNGNLRASYPDWDNAVWPDSITWRSWHTYTQQQWACLYCSANPSGFPCNLYSIPAVAGPTITSAGFLTLSSSMIQLYCTATAVSGSFASRFVCKQTGGPATAQIQYPYSPNTLISASTPGTYTFLETVTDNNQRTATQTLNIIIGAIGCTNCATFPIRVNLTH